MRVAAGLHGQHIHIQISVVPQTTGVELVLYPWEYDSRVVVNAHVTVTVASTVSNVVTRRTAMREPITYEVRQGEPAVNKLCCQLLHSKQWLWVVFYLCFSFYPSLLAAPTTALASRRSAGGAFLRGSSSGHPLLPIRWINVMSFHSYVHSTCSCCPL